MKRNFRLRYAFDICKELGIDDPVCWMNTVPPKVLDFWFAHASLLADERSEGTDSGMMKPEDLAKQLSATHG